MRRTAPLLAVCAGFALITVSCGDGAAAPATTTAVTSTTAGTTTTTTSTTTTTTPAVTVTSTTAGTTTTTTTSTTTTTVPAVTVTPTAAGPTTTTTSAASGASTTTSSSIPAAAAGDWIVFTWDDGPVPGTYGLLDIMDAYGVKTTFFALGLQVDLYPEVAREIAARGHSLQTHGYSHKAWTQLSDAEVRQDIERGIESIFNATGLRPTCVRPPYGAINARTRAVAESLGMQVVMWGYDSGDWNHKSSAQLVRNSATWKPNSVVLAHDLYARLWKPVLGQIIEGLLARNLRFSTICGYQ